MPKLGITTGFEGRSGCSVTICCLNRNTHPPNHTSSLPCHLKPMEVYQKSLELCRRLVQQVGDGSLPHLSSVSEAREGLVYLSGGWGGGTNIHPVGHHFFKPYVTQPGHSKRGPHTSSVSITWEPIRNAELLSHPDLRTGDAFTQTRVNTAG